MKTYLVCYGTPEYSESRKLLCESALKNGVDVCKCYDSKWLKKSLFYRKNKNILNSFRGAGYWLWKPYVILEALNQIKEGDTLIYSDCGVQIIKSINFLLKVAIEQSGLTYFSDEGLYLKNWTKRDCFIGMDADNSFFYKGSSNN